MMWRPTEGVVSRISYQRLKIKLMKVCTVLSFA